MHHASGRAAQHQKAGCGNPRITAAPTVARKKSASIATAVHATTPPAQRFRLLIVAQSSRVRTPSINQWPDYRGTPQRKDQPLYAALNHAARRLTLGAPWQAKTFCFDCRAATSSIPGNRLLQPPKHQAT